MKISLIALLSASAAVLGPLGAAAAPPQKDVDWQFNGGPTEDHYSPLAQINKSNVANLKEAWRFPMANATLETQPMMIGRTLYVVTPDRQLVALDAKTGEKKWAFDPKLKDTQPIRGLTSWTDGGKLRVVFGSQNMLYLIDAETGAPVPEFGDGGHIDINDNLRGPASANHLYLTSPAMVWQDLIYVNAREAENTPASPGDVRAFSAHTGKLVWTFHTIPHPGEVGEDTWPKDAYLNQGAANAWSGATVDVKRGIVFVATGCAADDFVGIDRPGDNRFANSVIALDARTGKRLWDFQEIHHDVWDADSTSPPMLLTLKHGGKMVDAVVSTNKQSYLYVFDRKTGKPFWPIVETPVPASNVPGEITSKTQPIPTMPRPMSRQTITLNDLNDSSAEDNAAAKAIYAKLYMPGQQFVPPAFNQDTLMIPGTTGGNEWAGMAGDPRKGVIYAAVSNGAQISRTEANPRFGQPDNPDDHKMVGDYQNGLPGLKFAKRSSRPTLPDGKSMFKGPLYTLNAVDLNTGEYRWTIPVDSVQGGGPVVTASGLLFIPSGGVLKAYDADDGKVLFSQKLPSTMGLTPAVYMLDGKEYVVLATGGRADAAYVAYALPN